MSYNKQYLEKLLKKFFHLYCHSIWINFQWAVLSDLNLLFVYESMMGKLPNRTEHMIKTLTTVNYIARWNSKIMTIVEAPQIKDSFKHWPEKHIFFVVFHIKSQVLLQEHSVKITYELLMINQIMTNCKHT